MTVPEPFTFSLRDNISGFTTDLDFRADITGEEIERAEAAWRPEFAKLRAALAGRGSSLTSEHGHWDWAKKRRHAGEQSFFLGVMCRDEMQGLMMCSASRLSRLGEDADLPLVFIDYLEVAPWNQPLLIEERRFSAIGSLLIEQAIELSRLLSYEGRIGLASLKQAEPFYRNCGMTDCGLEQFGAGIYRYFEMTARQANRFVEGWKWNEKSMATKSFSAGPTTKKSRLFRLRVSHLSTLPRSRARNRPMMPGRP
jgi:hypothetical protein